MKATCSGPECERPVHAHGLCTTHEGQMARRGWLAPAAPKLRGSTLNRLLEERVIDDNGCWLWFRALNDDGYGRVYHEGRRWRCHRLAWIYLRGPIPDGMEMDHLCRVRNCFNPDHLEVVTRAENNRRKWLAWREAS